MAYASGLDEGESFTTLELKINFLTPVWSGELAVTGQVVKSGRAVDLVDCDVHDESSRWWRAPPALA